MDIDQLLAMVQTILTDIKAEDVTVIDVREKTSITDYMVIATGTSSRHIRAMAQSIALAAKKVLGKPFKIEGEDSGEWVLVDLEDIVLHVMIAEARELYSLEKLWETTDSHRQQQG